MKYPKLNNTNVSSKFGGKLRFEKKSYFFVFKVIIFKCSDLSTRLQLNSQYSGNLLLIMFPVNSLVISLALLPPLA